MALKPGKYNPLKPDIELLDYKSKKRYGLKLEGQGALQVGTISQDDTVHIRTAGKQIGDFDEQRSWKGGRGIENLSSNPEGYWDSKDAWTLTKEHVHPTLLWRMGRGITSSEVFLPDKTHSVSWKQLFGTSKHLSMSFVPTAFTVRYSRLWIKRVGNPGTLTFRLHSDSSGNPGTVLQFTTATAADFPDIVSKFHAFVITSQALTATTYHISIFGDTNDNKTNHWEIGGYSGGSTGKISSDGSTWSAASFDIYYFLSASPTGKTFFSFFLDQAMYVVESYDDTTASRLFINGDRGKGTAVTSNSISDSGKAWATNRWAGARVKIVKGTGKGQSKEILSNTDVKLTIVGSWTVNPNTTSEYIIYSTEWFTEVSTTGLASVSGQPAVINQIVYFPQGAATTIRRMIWSGTAHVFSDEGTKRADYIIKSQSPTGTYAWKVLNDTNSGSNTYIASAPALDWANPPTTLTWGVEKQIGDTTYKITGLEEKEGLVYIFKEDGIWYTTYNGSFSKIQSGIDKTPSSVNGKAHIVHQQFMFYSWQHSIIRIYGSSHDDVGQDWSGWGLPDGREGNFSAFDSYTSLLIAAVDAGNGTSSVLGWDGLGWHEMFRAFDSAKRIRMVKVQPCPDTRNRTWIDVGGDLVFQEMPFQKGSPRLDSGVRYQHEAVIESSAIDMGTASGLAKFIKELTVYCENLGNGNEIHVDYQVDDDVHTSNWIEATTLYLSPESTAYLGLENIRKFAYRLRIIAGDNTNPPDILGVVPNGYARVPYKMVWTMRCRADNITSRGCMVKPDELMRWLLDSARYPGRVEMLSQYQLAHKFNVIIHPPRMFPYKPAQNGQSEESVLTLVLEES